MDIYSKGNGKPSKMKSVKERGVKHVEDTGKKSKPPSSHFDYTAEDSPKTEWSLLSKL